MIKQILFPEKVSDSALSAGLLLLRVVFAAMLMTHGWMKLMHFSDIAPVFLGGSLGLGLVVFAEFFCAMGVIVGFLYRLALIPMIINMGVAFFVAHKASVLDGEMALLYLIVFVVLFITGSGKYAVDKLIFK
jgi:putative oxidoreductase